MREVAPGLHADRAGFFRGVAIGGLRFGVRDQFVVCARELHMGDLTAFMALRSRDRIYYAEKAAEYAESTGLIGAAIGAFLGR